MSYMPPEILSKFISENCYNSKNKLDGSMITRHARKNEDFATSLKHYTQFLPEDIVWMLRVTSFLDGITSIPKCIVCGDNVSILQKRSFNRTCSSRECRNEISNTPEKSKKVSQSLKEAFSNRKEEIVSKRKQTSMKRYGVENPMENPNIREKVEKTKEERYGTKNHFLDGKAMAEASIQKHGMHHNKTKQVSDKRKQTCLNRYGVEHASKRDVHKDIVSGRWSEEKKAKIQDKKRKTSLERYGFENPMHHPDIAERAGNRFLWKEVEVNGVLFKVQGYEGLFIEEYFEECGNLDGLVHRRKDMPVIMYGENNQHRYFPDFFIPETNTIVEVKSEYTWFKYFWTNILKAEACVELGFNFVLKIY